MFVESVADDYDLIITSHGGQIIHIPADGIRVTGRSSQACAFDLRDDDVVQDATALPSAEDIAQIPRGEARTPMIPALPRRMPLLPTMSVASRKAEADMRRPAALNENARSVHEKCAVIRRFPNLKRRKLSLRLPPALGVIFLHLCLSATAGSSSISSSASSTRVANLSYHSVKISTSR